MGNNNPLDICANFIMSIDFRPELEEITPKNKITNQTNLNFKFFVPPDHPKQPDATYDAANGAVMALVTPEEKRPKPKMYFELEP